ncbi:secretin N-terminal domain-containing protein [Oceanicaulis sp. HTCC2633]|uniref:secretin N-terminal domain-containing protein n=1 Tax=Oceanicaulis sp. HTCC2633 TaxID=314254 RepID=UPI000325F96F|nr:secretin N-terminal domain-containing protein [Oceanicaulis sp. HTCC2633]
MQIKRLSVSALSCVALSGCALSSYAPESRLGPTLEARVQEIDGSAASSSAPVESSAPQQSLEEDLVSAPRTVPGQTGSSSDLMLTDSLALRGPSINATLPAQPLPSFLDTVLGEILEIPYALGPGVSDRDDIVTLRSVEDMSPQTFFTLFETAIGEYGLAVETHDNMVVVVERSDLRSAMPQIIQARARSSVASQLRPVIQFVEFDYADAAVIEAVVRQVFPDTQGLGIQTRRDINSMTLTGLSDIVNSANRLIEQLDRPRFAGATAVALSPRNWEAAELAQTLTDILSLEGFQIGLGGRQPRPLTLLPLEQTNQILVFAKNEDSLGHLIATARRLEEAAEHEDVTRSYVYQVRNTDAEELANIIRTVLGETGRSSSTGAETTAGETAGASSAVSSRLAVDTFGNRLIFTGNRNEYDNLARLLGQLDTPVSEVLVEVTIAEVIFSDTTRLGVEFFLNTLGGDVQVGTSDGLGLSSGGLSAIVDAGQLDIEAAARSTNSNINVLSTPRIVARSGESAEVQVGTDVPIITSQRAANTQDSGSTDILQSVSYRSTGVLLTVEPRVYSNNRIDLTIMQEVSSADDNPNQAIASPIISNRRMTSSITLQDGQTAVLGGLMSETVNRGSTGVPLVQDIPVLGNIFKTETFSNDQRVLLVLVTPYILNDRNDRQEIVDVFQGEVNDAFVSRLGPGATFFRRSQPIQLGRDE